MNEKRQQRELQKVIRDIKRNGSIFTFIKEKKNEYGEPTGEVAEMVTACGLFHITKGYVSKQTSDGSIIHSKGEPKILMTYEEAQKISNEHFVTINNSKYKITEKNDIQNFNIISDLSLEVVLNGNN